MATSMGPNFSGYPADVGHPGVAGRPLGPVAKPQAITSAMHQLQLPQAQAITAEQLALRQEELALQQDNLEQQHLEQQQLLQHLVQQQQHQTPEQQKQRLALVQEQVVLLRQQLQQAMEQYKRQQRDLKQHKKQLALLQQQQEVQQQEKVKKHSSSGKETRRPTVDSYGSAKSETFRSVLSRSTHLSTIMRTTASSSKPAAVPYTISQDRTAGEQTHRSHLLADLGRKRPYSLLTN